MILIVLTFMFFSSKCPKNFHLCLFFSFLFKHHGYKAVHALVLVLQHRPCIPPFTRRHFPPPKFLVFLSPFPTPASQASILLLFLSLSLLHFPFYTLWLVLLFMKGTLPILSPVLVWCDQLQQSLS